MAADYGRINVPAFVAFSWFFLDGINCRRLYVFLFFVRLLILFLLVAMHAAFRFPGRVTAAMMATLHP